jgi:hypothetical protein
MGNLHADGAWDTFTKWGDICRASTGIGNSYEVDGNHYTLQLSRKQQRDCAVVGAVYRRLSHDTETGISQVVKAGSFRIEPNGEVTRYPVGLKGLALSSQSA